MTYLVMWSAVAGQELAQLEAAANDPNRIREAGRWVDYTLRRCPLDMGESRNPGFRLWYGDVLGVYYRVDDVGMRVEVLAVGPARRH